MLNSLLDIKKAAGRLYGRVYDTAYWWLKPLPKTLPLMLQDLASRGSYPHVTVEDVKKTKRSDTLFVFGSGSSINDISEQEWRAMERHNTLGLSQFYRNQKVRIDYHMIAEMHDMEEECELIRTNPCYANTLYFVQQGIEAIAGNYVISKRLLPAGSKVFRFRRTCRGSYAAPSRTLKRIVHGWNSITSCANLGYCMGFRRIVLVGVDMYDKRYFFLPSDFTRDWEEPGITYSSPFPGGEETAEMMGRWRKILESENVELSVFNPKSLLTKTLPVFDRNLLGGH